MILLSTIFIRVQPWSTRFEKKKKKVVKGNQAEERNNATKGMESVFYNRKEKLGSFNLVNEI